MSSLFDSEIKNNLIPHVHFRVNDNTIPFSKDDSDSWWGTVSKMETVVNTLIDKCNELIQLNSPMNEKYTETVKNIKELREQLNTFINEFDVPDGSIDIKKLNPEFLNDLDNYIVEQVHQSCKFVTFGIEDGYWTAYIPDSWSDEVEFSTTDNFELCIDIKG